MNTKPRRPRPAGILHSRTTSSRPTTPSSSSRATVNTASSGSTVRRNGWRRPGARHRRADGAGSAAPHHRRSFPLGMAQGVLAAAQRRGVGELHAGPLLLGGRGPQTARPGRARARKRQRLGPQRTDRLTAGRPDELWAVDCSCTGAVEVDVTADGRQIRFCHVIDEFTCEALATRGARSFTADATVNLLDEIVSSTGRRPANVRMDNGPEFTAAAMRDWCPFSAVETAFIEPGAPWQSGHCESFNGRFRDELLTCEQFDTLLEAQVLAEDWRIEYNTIRPTEPSAGSPPPRTTSDGSTNQQPHSWWTTDRGPVMNTHVATPVRLMAATPDIGRCNAPLWQPVPPGRPRSGRLTAMASQPASQFVGIARVAARLPGLPAQTPL